MRPTSCTCVDLYTCPHFLTRMEIEEKKDRALFTHPQLYDHLLLMWERLFVAGADIHGINMLGFKDGQYLLTPPSEQDSVDTSTSKGSKRSPFAPVPFTPPSSAVTYSVLPHITTQGRIVRGQNLPEDPKVARRAAKVRKEVLKELARWSDATR